MSIELNRLQAFRAEDAAADPEARRAARAALLARIEGSAGRPAPAHAAYRTGRRRILTGGLALAGAAAAALALLSPGGVPTEPATAAQLLRRAALVAADGPDVVLRPGQYWYTRSESTSLSSYGGRRPFGVLLHMRREAWIAPEGGGRVRQGSVGAPRFVRAGDRRDWIASGRPELRLGMMDVPLVEEDGTVPEPYSLGGDALSYADLRALPTATDALYARVASAAHENDNSHGDAHEMFTIVGDMLREAPTPPALRAALFRVAARIPGVELVGATRDAAGRRGVAVALGEPHERAALVFDPRTARLLGEREELGGAPSFVTAYLESGVVGSTHERP